MLPSKSEIRILAEGRRAAQPDKDRLSAAICHRVTALPEFARARTVLGYVGVRSEVRTLALLCQAIQEGKQVVVPYCAGDELGLFRLRSAEELAPARFGLLEPKPELRTQPERSATIAEVELVLVPGVAFDRSGARVGHGRGYFDKLLAHARPDTLRIGLAFECQMMPRIPTEPHDVRMHLVVTEQAVYHGAARRAT